MKKPIMVMVVGCLLASAGLSGAANQSQSPITDEFTFQGKIDVMAFNMTNPALTETSDWYFYPVYRTIVSKGFARQNFLIQADVEKPGYANITYPIIKLNELYAKFQQSTFYVKLGRQLFGDQHDLLLGFQNDAVSMGFELPTFNVMVFFAKTNLLVPWGTGGAIESMLGAVPSFDLGPNMKLDAKLLIGFEPITVTPITTPPSQPSDEVNTLVQAGGRYELVVPIDNGASLDLNAQLAVQMGIGAKTATDNNIDATSVGMKVDASYGMTSGDVDYKIGGHIIYTGGDPEPGVNTKAGFASLNALPGAGPGLFSKIEDGAGPYTFIDRHLTSGLIRNLVGLFAIGITAELEVGQFVPAAGFWSYSDTNDSGKALGIELNGGLGYRLSNTVSFYGQLAYYVPNREGLEQRGLWPINPPAPLPALPDPENVLKLLVGSSINF